MTMGRRLTLLASVFTWPAFLLHELAHAAVATLGADRVAVEDPVGSPTVRVEWTEGVSGWLIVASAYAPLVSGIGLGGLGLAWALVSGVPLPSGAREWLVVAIGATWYGIYITPSLDDVRTAQEGIDRVRE